MKIIINKKTLEKHLENISRALNSTNPFPALTGILITANELDIHMIVSNGNLSIREQIIFTPETKVTDAGKILVPGKLFKEIIKKQGDIVEIIANDKNVKIVSKGFETTINLLNADEYPTISFESFGKDLIIDSEKLVKIIKNVSFAAADNDKRIILNGVNLFAEDGILTAIATNSFRLAQEKIEISSDVSFNITILSKNLRDFFPQNAKGELKLKVDDNKIITIYETSTVVSKLIDGVYPDVSKLIPNQNEITLETNVKDLQDLIDKATVISEEATKIIKLTIYDDELSLESRRSEIGNTLIKTKNFTASTKEFSIIFNAIFLKDAISRFTDKIVIGFNGEFKAFIIYKDENNKNLIQLILPHRSF